MLKAEHFFELNPRVFVDFEKGRLGNDAGYLMI
jgi:hypothetical protein